MVLSAGDKSDAFVLKEPVIALAGKAVLTCKRLLHTLHPRPPGLLGPAPGSLCLRWLHWRNLPRTHPQCTHDSTDMRGMSSPRPAWDLNQDICNLELALTVKVK